jgi:hypothetical protein
MTREKLHKNGWFVCMMKDGFYYRVICRKSNGELHDKMLCDTYKGACEYYSAFNRIATNA